MLKGILPPGTLPGIDTGKTQAKAVQTDRTGASTR